MNSDILYDLIRRREMYCVEQIRALCESHHVRHDGFVSIEKEVSVRLISPPFELGRVNVATG